MSEPQFEVFERTIAQNQTITVTASREPERWLIYLVDNTFSGTIAVLPGGSLPTSGAQRLFSYTRLIVPGVTPQITLRNDGNKAAPIVLSAVTALPLEIERLTEGGEQGNPDRGGRMRNGTDYTVASGSESFYTKDTVDYDTDNMCSVSPNNRLIVRTPGKYLVYCHIVYFAMSNEFYLYLWRNQTQIISMDRRWFPAAGGGQYVSLNCMTVYQFNANDYIQAVTWQNSGNSRLLKAYAYYSGVLGAQRLAG